MSKVLAPACQYSTDEAQASDTAVVGDGNDGVGRERLLESPMKFIGFVYERISANCLEGRFTVNKNSAQVFGVLHGGVSALIAESLASLGVLIASGFQRIAGVQLSINHLRAVPIGTEVFVSAKPSQLGKRLQVWDVTFSKVGDSEKQTDKDDSIFAVSRVTLMTGLTGQAKEYFEQELKLLARL
ncbi:hypothetical protein L7F22_057261 [Adiantum nelumboides]|nr:hypothetical protein [Adiantum nelumboides]